MGIEHGMLSAALPYAMKCLYRSMQREEAKRTPGDLIREPKLYLWLGTFILLAGLVGVVLLANTARTAADPLPFGVILVMVHVLTVPAALPLFCIYFNRRILLKEDHLLYRNGWGKEQKIPYDSILNYEIIIKKIPHPTLPHEAREDAPLLTIVLFTEADRFRYPNGKKYEFGELLGLCELDEKLIQVQHHELVTEERGSYGETIIRYRRNPRRGE